MGGYVVIKLLGVVFKHYILGVGVHCSHIVVNDPLFVFGYIRKGNSRRCRELLCGIIRAEVRPVMVCAQEYFLIGMLRKRSVRIHGLHVFTQVVNYTIYIVKLTAAKLTDGGRAVKLA